MKPIPATFRHQLCGITKSNVSGRCEGKPKSVLAVWLRRADFTHRHRRTVSAPHWRWGEGRKNSERSRACSHTSHSYSMRGPGTHSHLQRAPQTLVTVWTSAWGLCYIMKINTLFFVTGRLGAEKRSFWHSPKQKANIWSFSCSIHRSDTGLNSNVIMFLLRPKEHMQMHDDLSIHTLILDVFLVWIFFY